MMEYLKVIVAIEVMFWMTWGVWIALGVGLALIR